MVACKSERGRPAHPSYPHVRWWRLSAQFEHMHILLLTRNRNEVAAPNFCFVRMLVPREFLGFKHVLIVADLQQITALRGLVCKHTENRWYCKLFDHLMRVREWTFALLCEQKTLRQFREGANIVGRTRGSGRRQESANGWNDTDWYIPAVVHAIMIRVEVCAIVIAVK